MDAIRSRVHWEFDSGEGYTTFFDIFEFRDRWRLRVSLQDMAFLKDFQKHSWKTADDIKAWCKDNWRSI